MEQSLVSLHYIVRKEGGSLRCTSILLSRDRFQIEKDRGDRQQPLVERRFGSSLFPKRTSPAEILVYPEM